MGSFINDCRIALKMLRGTVRDEDDNVLTLWEKLGVVVEIILGIIVFDPTPRRKDDF